MYSGRNIFYRFLGLATAVAVAPAWAIAAAPNSREPVHIEADEMRYDQEHKIVAATGNVQVTQGERIVLAQTLTYDEGQNMVLASGKVSVLEPDGNVYFAERVAFTDDLKEGIVHSFRARLSDNSLLAANEAERLSPEVVKLRKAVYSPCKLCEEDPAKAPLWQLKAREVTHDTAAQRMSYRDAFLEVYGVPVLYTPYFSHPTPEADRKSGILTPVWKRDSNLGTIASVPYYWNINETMDATITPTITSEEGPALGGEFRHLTQNGYYELKGSITNPDQRDTLGNLVAGENEIRGHVEGFGQFQINPAWSWGFSGKRASDDTYLGRYGYGYEDTLTSTAYAEKVQGREFAMLRALSFQGLRPEDDPATTPYVLPLMAYRYETNPGYADGRWFFDSNIAAIGRDLGAQSRRFSGTVGWRAPFITNSGHRFDASARVRGDAFSVKDFQYLDQGALVEADDVSTRLFPEAELAWRYPLMKRLGNGSHLTIGPRASIVASPNGNNPEDIPNEDSRIVEFSAANLFNPNRYPGYDAVESGNRANYGMEGQWYISDSRLLEYLVGQSYNFSNDDMALYLSDPGEQSSDIVGRVGLRFDALDVAYRFRFDEEDLSTKRSEVNAGLNFSRFNMAVDFDSLQDDPYLGDRDQLGMGANLVLTDNWTFTTSGRRDLSSDGGWIHGGVGLLFHNECIMLLTGVNREFTRDRDIEPSTSFIVRVGLKNLE